MSDTPRTDRRVIPQKPKMCGCFYSFEIIRADFARQLERELNAAKAENADKLALIKRLHRAITARMSADDPTDEERMELMQAWTSAQETIDKAKL